MRITSKGQITIPRDIRERTGLLPHTEVELTVEPDGIRIVRARPRSRGAEVVERLRRGGRHLSMSTAEIMALTRDIP